MPRLARQLLSLLNRRERWQLAILLGAMIVQAAFELVGVANIAPFMSVVGDTGPISGLSKSNVFNSFLVART